MLPRASSPPHPYLPPIIMGLMRHPRKEIFPRVILVLISKHKSTHGRLTSRGPRTHKILDLGEGLEVSVTQTSRWWEGILYKILELEGVLRTA